MLYGLWVYFAAVPQLATGRMITSIHPLLFILVLTLLSGHTGLEHPSASLNLLCMSVCVCQDSDWSGDVGVFDGRHSRLPGLLTG